MTVSVVSPRFVGRYWTLATKTRRAVGVGRRSEDALRPWLFRKAGMSGDEAEAAFRRGAARHRVKYSRLKRSAYQRRLRRVRETVGGG